MPRSGRGQSVLRLGATTDSPNTPLHKTMIYEAHVRGLTMQHPDVPPELRGTYAGVASPSQSCSIFVSSA